MFAKLHYEHGLISRDCNYQCGVSDCYIELDLRYLKVMQADPCIQASITSLGKKYNKDEVVVVSKRMWLEQLQSTIYW